MQTAIPCVLMRGGTSRGPFFLADDLPAAPAIRDAVLLAAMGSGHPLQIDGLGGGNPLTSKVAIVSRSAHPEADIDYLFAQVAVDRQRVDTAPNCGNMLAGVGPFAIEAGLIAARDPVTSVRIHNVNTGALVEARVQTPGGAVTYEGTTSIPGVSGTAAPVALRFHRIAGGCSGALFPTGQRQERIMDVPVTLLDCATAVMLVPAASLGADMAAGPEALRADTALCARIEVLRLEAGRRMGFGDVTDRVLPKPVLIGAAADADLAVRYFTPWEVHRALAVTGGIAIAAAIQLPGTVAAELAATRPPGRAVRLRHPAGILEIMLESDGTDIAWAEVTRTARRLFEGKVLIPAGIWDRAETLRRAA